SPAVARARPRSIEDGDTRCEHRRAGPCAASALGACRRLLGTGGRTRRLLPEPGPVLSLVAHRGPLLPRAVAGIAGAPDPAAHVGRPVGHGRPPHLRGGVANPPAGDPGIRAAAVRTAAA